MIDSHDGVQAIHSNSRRYDNTHCSHRCTCNFQVRFRLLTCILLSTTRRLLCYAKTNFIPKGTEVYYITYRLCESMTDTRPYQRIISAGVPVLITLSFISSWWLGIMLSMLGSCPIHRSQNLFSYNIIHRLLLVNWIGFGIVEAGCFLILIQSTWLSLYNSISSFWYTLARHSYVFPHHSTLLYIVVSRQL